LPTDTHTQTDASTDNKGRLKLAAREPIIRSCIVWYYKGLRICFESLCCQII